jgi:SAM-dependent methyltransferase
VGVIPFYGAERPDLFAIERTAMDRPGRVIAALDRLLPAGLVADIGAGDGFTADRLTGGGRHVIAAEPAGGMRRPGLPVNWTAASAEALPFAGGSLAAAYATWAYFFSRDWDPSPGLAELDRCVDAGGPLVVVDNLGGDEFTAAMGPQADPEYWAAQGFATEVVDTVFEFEDAADARTLLDVYFGPSPTHGEQLCFSYRVGVFTRPSRGRR